MKIVKYALVLTVALAVAPVGTAGAQTPAKPAPKAPPSAEALVAQRDAKLKEKFLTLAPWMTDFDAAKAEAKKTGKPLFTYFTRSYAH